MNTLKSWGNSFVENITNKWTDVKSTVSAVLGGDIQDNGINTFTVWTSAIGVLQSAWTGKKATFKADTGGQITRISDLTSWQTTFGNLYNSWKDKKATFKASVGEQISKIADLDTWKTKITNLWQNWKGNSADFKAKVGDQLKSITDLDTWKTKITNLWQNWKGGDASYKISLGGISKITDLDTWKDKIYALYQNWKGGSASYTVSFNQSLGTMEGYRNAIQGIYDNWKGRDATFNIWANIDSNLDTFASNLVDAINSKLAKSTNYKLVNFAEGGLLINGVRKSIPQYASGSLNAGSLFWAGEGGSPELVGHMNGRTEVLNKSQIASVMYASMTNAMRNFGSPTAPPTIRANGSVGTYNPNNTSGSNSDALLMEQNRLIAEQNMLLERIAEKDTTISVNDIFSAMRVESNNYYNRTGNSAFVGF